MAVTAAEGAAIGTGVIGAVQLGIGLLDKAAARRRQQALFKKRTTYQTPQELYDILNASASRAQSGYDPATLAYLTGQTDQAFGAATGSAERLGADPNSLSAIFNQKVNSIMKIGAENHALNMENFSKYLGAVNTIAQSKTAEQVSKENLLRDQLQAEGVNFQNANANAQSGLNAVLGAGASLAQMQLFKDKNKTGATALTSFLPTTQNSMLLDNNLQMGAGTNIAAPPLGYVWDATQGKWVRS